MNFVDLIILAIVFIIVSLIVYFTFIKPKKENISPCSKCAYRRDCIKKDDKNNKC